MQNKNKNQHLQLMLCMPQNVSDLTQKCGLGFAPLVIINVNFIAHNIDNILLNTLLTLFDS